MFLARINKRKSILAKLMQLYSLSTVGLLICIALFLYPTFMKIIAIKGQELSQLSVECFEKFIIIILFGSLLSIFLGYTVAKNGLKKLSQFEQEIAQMSVNSLNKRINLHEWPQEIQSVAQTFNEMLDRLEKSFLQISQFSSDIAHELRNPIHNLKSMVEVTLLGVHSLDTYQDTLINCMHEYDQLIKLIENLLFIARSDHGQIILNKTAFSVKNEILHLCHYYQELAKEKQIQMICTGDACLFADLVLFKRVINNLLANALYYMVNPGLIHIQISLQQECIHISIHDQGPGIPKEHIPHLTTRFYRVDPARSPQSGGLGLGLAMVQSIIALHQGKLEITSQPNQGTSVHVYLPK